jgi:hypothetical protein
VVDACDKVRSVAAGPTVNGTGTKTVIAKSLVRKGKRLDTYVETATGTATDSAAATYTWDYASSLVTSGKKPPFKGVAIDHFELIAQNGTVVVHAFFIANMSVAANGDATFTPTVIVGDPLDFTTLALHCDPL